MRRILPMIFLGLLTQYAAAGDNWPQFGGPTGNRMSDAVGLPLTWSETKNIAGKTNRTVDLSDFPYGRRRGYGTPTVYRTGDRLEMITTAALALYGNAVKHL